MSYIGSTEWYQKIQAGEVAGHSIVHKFGFGSVGTVMTPITLSTQYRMPTAATGLELVSDDADDTSAGTGARVVTVIGLNSAWTEVSQDVTMNGTTAVALATDLVRVFRMFVAQSGTYRGTNEGTLTLRESGAGQTWAQIGVSPIPLGQSLIGCYTIPTGKTGYIVGAYFSADTVKTVDIMLLQIPGASDVSAPFVGAERVLLYEVGISGVFKFTPRTPSSGIVGPADIRALALTGTGTADVSVDFEILLVDD